ncbi:MAG: hypothetical protein JNL84_04010 [Candidatus Accumulibacter sp.]|nr:hypothetical protein [Accumulibacter sp.]
MAGFENYHQGTQDIELEIERKGIALGIDWQDEVQVRALAREALDYSADQPQFSTVAPLDHRLMARVELFGLAGLMLRTMEESAGMGVESHGGEVWKAFARALWAEAEMRKT